MPAGDLPRALLRAEQDPKWYGTAEPEDGPLVTRMREVAKAHNMVLVVPWFEEAQTGVYYNPRS